MREALADLHTQIYVTVLATLPTVSISLRTSLGRNLDEIIALHEEILGDLHAIVPYSEYTQFEIPQMSVQNPPDKTATSTYAHHRWSGVITDNDQSRKSEHLQAVPGMLLDPHVAADISKMFAKKVSKVISARTRLSTTN